MIRSTARTPTNTSFRLGFGSTGVGTDDGVLEGPLIGEVTGGTGLGAGTTGETGGGTPGGGHWMIGLGGLASTSGDVIAGLTTGPVWAGGLGAGIGTLLTTSLGLPVSGGGGGNCWGAMAVYAGRGRVSNVSQSGGCQITWGNFFVLDFFARADDT